MLGLEKKASHKTPKQKNTTDLKGMKEAFMPQSNIKYHLWYCSYKLILYIYIFPPLVKNVRETKKIQAACWSWIPWDCQ